MLKSIWSTWRHNKFLIRSNLKTLNTLPVFIKMLLNLYILRKYSALNYSSIIHSLSSSRTLWRMYLFTTFFSCLRALDNLCNYRITIARKYLYKKHIIIVHLQRKVTQSVEIRFPSCRYCYHSIVCNFQKRIHS